MWLNARSLSNIVHLIAVTETWFLEEKPASACTLQGYEQFHHDRESTGGGVALYVQEDMNAT